MNPSDILNEKYRKQRNLILKLPVSYRIVPRQLRTALLGMYGKLSRSRFPKWPLDTTADDMTNKRGRRCLVVLTHDIDSQEAVDNIDKLIAIEKKHGVKSCINILANKYDVSKFKNFERRGFEIGCHGWDHDGGKLLKNLFLIGKAKKKLKDFNIKGFRSPSLVRNDELFKQVSKHFKYDSSVPNSHYPMGSGCCSVFPFKKGKLLEIPITVPQDYHILDVLKFSNQEAFKIWKYCFDEIIKRKGIICLIAHPESYDFGGHLKLYEKIIRYLKSKKLKFVLPRQLLRYSFG